MSPTNDAVLTARVARWVRATLGEALLNDRRERAARVVEEATELAQAEGLSAEEVRRIQDRVYSRPVGEPWREAGGLMVTLYAWAACCGEWLDTLTVRELERIEDPKVAQRVREKQVEKFIAGTGRNVDNGG